MGYLINVMYGESCQMQRFRFDTANTTNPDEKFDEAVKAINRRYKEQGRFKTSIEVTEHFRKYGFYRVAI